MFGKNLKYKNKIVKINGVKVADSKKEHRRGLELKLLEERGLIKNLKEQVKFQLLPSFRDGFGGKELAINYIADFTYLCLETNRLVCEDIKSNESKRKVKIVNGKSKSSRGFSTAFKPEYVMKRKLFKSRYPEYFFFENYKRQPK